MKEKIQTEKKPPKPPREFRKPIKAEKFEKRYAKQIEHPDDANFFTRCFTKQDEAYVLNEGLNRDDILRLKSLLNTIKTHRQGGGINLFPLAFAGIIVGGIIVFVTVFANPLLGRATEKALEAVFDAKADVYNFRLNVFRFTFSIDRITVADRDKPMTNLFDMGRILISLNSTAVLRGQFYINEVSASNIQFGTVRKVSGALPAKPPKAKPEKAPSDSPPLLDLENFDAMALLDREFDKLMTPKLYDDAINLYNETFTKYKEQVDAAKTRADQLRTQSQPLLSLNMNNFRLSSGMPDVPAITKTVQEINTLVNTVQATADDATKLVNGLETDIKKAQTLEQNARTAITSDIDHLKSYIDLGSGAAFAALEPSIREILTGVGEQYLDYGLIALGAFEKIKADQAAKPKDEKPKKVKKEKFKGRDVPFPTRAYPKFYLGKFASDITNKGWKGEFDLSNISSDPDMTFRQTNNPAVTLKINVTEVGGSAQRRAGFSGSADFRSTASERFNAVADGSGFPVALGNELKDAGIGGMNGMTTFRVNVSGTVDGGASFGGDVKILQPQVVSPHGILGNAVDSAVRQVGSIDLGIQYTHHTKGNDVFKLTTNIGDLIGKALRAAAEGYAQKAMDEIEKALRAKIAQYIDDRFASKEDVDALFALARGDKAAMDQLRNSLNSKKSEFENQARAAGQQVVDDLKDQAVQAGQQAVQDIMKGNVPSAPNIKLPSTGGIKLPGR